ncbi:hypothetical protein MRX96_003796 [Rhipicephalus microplus]
MQVAHAAALYDLRSSAILDYGGTLVSLITSPRELRDGSDGYSFAGVSKLARGARTCPDATAASPTAIKNCGAALFEPARPARVSTSATPSPEDICAGVFFSVREVRGAPPSPVVTIGMRRPLERATGATWEPLPARHVCDSLTDDSGATVVAAPAWRRRLASRFDASPYCSDCKHLRC